MLKDKETRTLIEFLQGLRKGYTLTIEDISALVWVVERLESRLSAGRKRKFNSAQERWKFHNEKRKKKIVEGLQSECE